MVVREFENRHFYKEYIIIGSGISGLLASKELENFKKDHIILTSFFSSKATKKTQKSRFNNIEFKRTSPKLNIESLKKELKNWNNFYNLNCKGFNLIQTLSNSTGGLTQYWGANLGHNYNEIIESNIEQIMEVNKACDIKDLRGIKMQSHLADKLLLSKTDHSKLINVFSPFLGIKIKNEDQSLCRKCKAHYCNCDGKLLQKYNFKRELIEELEIIDINKTKNDIFLLTGTDKKNKTKMIECKYIIFACGPIASSILLNKLVKLPDNLNLNHNGLFSFPFISLFASKQKSLALSNLNISINFLRNKSKNYEPEFYANIFTLKPQLLIRFPFLKILSKRILNRLYYCIVYTDSSFVKSKFNIQNKKIRGKYKISFFYFSILVYLRLIPFLLIKGLSIPIFFPIFSKPGSDIHYGSTLANINLSENLDKRIFFADSSRVEKISAINSTIKNLVFARKGLKNWIKEHN